MSRLVSHDARKLIARAALDVEHLTSLESNEAWVCQIERNRKSGYALRGEPFLGEPDVRAKTKAAALESFVESVDAWLEPGSFDRQTEVLDSELKQSFGGPGGPWESSFCHGGCQ